MINTLNMPPKQLQDLRTAYAKLCWECMVRNDPNYNYYRERVIWLKRQLEK